VSAHLLLVVFVVQGQRYALALDAVEHALPMAVSPMQEAPPVVLGVITVHGRIVPVLERALSASAP
jgi:purine-binding chemotaxis protein CheW